MQAMVESMSKVDDNCDPAEKFAEICQGLCGENRFWLNHLTKQEVRQEKRTEGDRYYRVCRAHSLNSRILSCPTSTPKVIEYFRHPETPPFVPRRLIKPAQELVKPGPHVYLGNKYAGVSGVTYAAPTEHSKQVLEKVSTHTFLHVTDRGGLMR